MKHLEFLDGNFFYVQIRSKVLASLLDDHFLINVDDDVVRLPWVTKGDALIGDDEQVVNFSFGLYRFNVNTDICQTLISFFQAYINTGLSDEYNWREAMRYYSHDANINYSEEPLYEEKLDSDDIDKIINILQNNKDTINDDIDTYCIFEYYLNGDYESELKCFAKNGSHCVYKKYDESDIDEWTESEYFFESFVVNEYSLECISEALLKEYWPYN